MGLSPETKNHMKFLRKKNKEQALRRDSALKMYDTLIAEDGRYDEDVMPEVCEKFEIKSVKTLQRWLQKRGGYLNPASKAINDVIVLEQMGRLLQSAKEHDEVLLARMEELDEIDGEWVDIEQTEDNRGVSTKRISKYEALRKASKDRVDNSQEFFKAARAIIPQTVLNQVIDNRKEADSYSDSELDEMLKGEV